MKDEIATKHTLWSAWMCFPLLGQDVVEKVHLMSWDYIPKASGRF